MDNEDDDSENNYCHERFQKLDDAARWLKA